METPLPCTLVQNHRDLMEIVKTREGFVALFYASWCPFCREFLPAFTKRAEQGGQRFVLVQDDQETMADHYAVKVYPTVLFFENGVVAKRLDGAPGVGLKEEALTKFVERCRPT